MSGGETFHTFPASMFVAGAVILGVALPLLIIRILYLVTQKPNDYRDLTTTIAFRGMKTLQGADAGVLFPR